MMSSIGKAPHLVSAHCAMLLVGTSYQQESPSLIHPVLQPRRQRRDAARENGEDVRPRAGVGRQDRTLPQAAGAGMQSPACHNKRVSIELSTDLCKVSQCQEKAPTRRLSTLSSPLVYHKDHRFLIVKALVE